MSKTEQESPFGFNPEIDVARQEHSQWLDPIIIVSGGFDPVHKGHTAMFNAAAEYGKVHIFLNSDDWLTRKKGAPFLPYETRENVLKNMSSIHKVHSVDDRDETIVKGLLELRKQHPNTKMLFANGGDRKLANTPEIDFCKELDIKMLWNVGGEKIDSSSDLLSKYKHYHGAPHVVSRKWGTYEVLMRKRDWVVKILTILPKKSISLQKHQYRAEQWFILEGKGIYASKLNGAITIKLSKKGKGAAIFIPPNVWHWIKNTSGNESLIILETWFGEKLEESDIERKEDESEIIIPE